MDQSQYQGVAKDIRRVVGPGPFWLTGVDDGGYRIMGAFSDALNNEGIATTYDTLVQGSLDKALGYRPILGIRGDPKDRDSKTLSASDVGPLDVSAVIVVDDDVHYADSSTGTMFWLLQNADELGFTTHPGFRLYLFVDLDHYFPDRYDQDRIANIGHFALKRAGGEDADIRDAMRMANETEYAQLESAGKIDLIGSYPANVLTKHSPSLVPSTDEGTIEGTSVMEAASSKFVNLFRKLFASKNNKMW